MSVDLSGRHVGGFHFLRRLGRGAMADVYLAEQVHLKRWVAVKILRPELADDKTLSASASSAEAQAAASLVHANIVQIHEVGHVDGLHFIVQEYVQGQNLPRLAGPQRAALAAAGPVDHAADRRRLGQGGRAGRDPSRHQAGKHHDHRARARSKWPISALPACSRKDAEATALTQIGITMGTPLYMSPEQVEGRSLDHRSDLYSFGVLCYHMLTGKPPFVGDTALAVAVQHVKKQPQGLELQRPDLPPALCRVIHQMLAKEPDSMVVLRRVDAGALSHPDRILSAGAGRAAVHGPTSAWSRSSSRG